MALHVSGKRAFTFPDRQVAGQMLGRDLKERGVSVSGVFGLTRGGVPVAYEVAKALEVPLDIIVVKKLRAPLNPELAIGAICADGKHILHTDDIKEMGVSDQYVQHEVQVRLAEAQAAEKQYRGGLPPLDVADKAVLVIDDGIATGATMEAAVLSLRQRGARRILVAVPVGSESACQGLSQTADEAFCLHQPVLFWGVGQFYDRFPQVGDDEVTQFLKESRDVMAQQGGQKPGARRGLLQT